MKKKVIVIPDWISTRFFCDENDVFCRAYIYNSVSREVVILEDTSAVLWNLILRFGKYEKLQEYIIQKDIQEELDVFLTELESIGIIKWKKENFEGILYSRSQNVCTTYKEELDFFTEIKEFGKKLNLLLALTIELTYKCNEKCVHCFNHKNMSEYEIKFEDLKPVIDQAYDLGLFSVTLTGGESTLAKDFLNIAKYISKKRISLSILTNGLNLYENNYLFNEIVNLRPMRVEISVYSLDKKIHDFMTGVKGSFDKTIEVVKRLKKENINVVMKCFLTKYNIDGADKVIKFAKDENIDLIYDELFINNTENNNKEVQASLEQIKDFFSKNPPYSSDVYNGDTICKAGHTSLAINPKLDVNLCNVLEIKLGNLKETSMQTIWKNSEVLKKWRKYKKEDIKGCYNREYCNYCNYCPGRSFFENKEIAQILSHCEIAKIKRDIIEKNDKSK